MQDHSTVPAVRVTIYALCEPEQPDMVRYVGQTRQELKRRYAGHFSEIKHYDSPKNRWLSALIASGRKPLLRTLAITDEDHANAMERDYIAGFVARGCAVLNCGQNRPHGRRRIAAQKKDWQPVAVLLPREMVQQLQAMQGTGRGSLSRSIQRILREGLADGRDARPPGFHDDVMEGRTLSIQVRFPLEVRTQVEALARHDYRTLPNQVLVLVKEALAARAATVPAALQPEQQEGRP